MSDSSKISVAGTGVFDVVKSQLFKSGLGAGAVQSSLRSGLGAAAAQLLLLDPELETVAVLEISSSLELSNTAALATVHVGRACFACTDTDSRP